MKHKSAPGIHHARLTTRLAKIHAAHKALHAAPINAVAEVRGIDPLVIDTTVKEIEAQQ